MLKQLAQCQSLDEVRENIDRIDRSIVALIAERGQYVKQAAGFKRSTAEVKAPDRVEEVITKVKYLAEETGASPAIIEKVYRAMIDAFITMEVDTHRHLTR